MSETENTNTNPIKVKRKTRGWQFYVKIVGVLGLSLVVAFAIAILYVLDKLSSDSNFEKLVNQKVSQAINMDVSFEKIGISFPSLEFTNIRIATDSVAMKLDSKIASVKVRPDFLAALSGNVVVDYLKLDSSSTYLQMKAVKSNNEAVKAENKKSEPFDISKIAFPFKSLDIKDVSFNYVDDSSKANYDVKLNKATVSYSILSSALPYEIDLEWVNKASLKASGDLYWPSRLLANIDLITKDINEIKKLIPKEYEKYVKDLKSSKVHASIDFNNVLKQVKITKYSVVAEPLLCVNGKADIPQLSPLSLQSSASINPIKTKEIWPLVKDFVPQEYNLSLLGGTLGADLDVKYDANKPLDLSAVAKPENIQVKTDYGTDPVVLQKGLITYKDNNLVVSDFILGVGESKARLQNLQLSLNNMNVNAVFDVDLGFESLLLNLSKYLSPSMKKLAIAGNLLLSGNINGNLNDINSLKINGFAKSDKIAVIDKQTKTEGLVEKLSVKLNALGKESGTIEVESLKATAAKATIEVTGLIKNQADLGFDCKAKGGINVDEFSKLAFSLFGLDVKEGQYRGNLDLDLLVAGTVSNPLPSGKLVAKNLYADLSQFGMVVDDLNGTIAADKDKLVFNNVKAKLLGGEVDLNGVVSNFKKMKISAVANTKGTDLAEVRKLIGVYVPDMGAELTFGGRADLNASLEGLTSSPTIKGSAQIANGNFAHPAVLRPIEQINGRISFNNSGLNTEALAANWGTSKVNLSGSIKDWAKFITNFKFDVAPLDLTDVAGFFLKDTGYQVLGCGKGKGTITGAIEKIKVDCNASVDIGTFTAVITEGGDSMKFPYEKLQARAIYHDNTLDVASASLNLFKGDITAKAKVFLASEPIRFDVDANIKQLQTQEFLKVNASSKYANTLVGGIDGFAKLNGDVTGLNSIQGKANLAMPKGSYDSPDIIKKLADKLKNPSLASGTIENLVGDYEIEKGRISSNNMMGKSKDGKVYYRGSIGLDTSLEGNLDFELGKEICSKSSYMRELLGNQESLNLSAKIGGTITSPNVDLPLDDLLKKAAKNELGKLLEKQGISSDKLDGIADKVGDKLSNGLNKLGKNLKNLFK